MPKRRYSRIIATQPAINVRVLNEAGVVEATDKIGFSSSQKNNCSTPRDAVESENDTISEGEPFGTNLQSAWQNRMMKTREAWDDSRDCLVHALTAKCSPATFMCCECNTVVDAIIRCSDCGPWAYFCVDCCNQQHKHVIMHVAEMWTGYCFVPISMTPEVWNAFNQHDRTYISKKIIVIDMKGRQHEVVIEYNEVDGLLPTLIKYDLWPASPVSPDVAFHIPVLNLIKSLVLECQAAVMKVLDALLLLSATLFPMPQKINHLYRALVTSGSWFEYLFVSHEVASCRSSGLDESLQCPACPVTHDEVQPIYCMDANFGLVRKASAGVSDRRRFGDILFVDSAEVQEFVNGYNDMSKRQDSTCSDFKAGNRVRSAKKTAKLDETGVFGAVCRHEYPVMFMSMKHGERFGYPVALLKKLVRNNEAFAFYDIACLLETHLKKRNDSDLLDKITFGIPLFHCYGHKMSCQVAYNPRRLKGVGLTDGEGIERLWSYLRRFAKMTKEMTSSHREDMLTLALIHHRAKIRRQLGSILFSKLQRAREMQTSAEKELISQLPTDGSLSLDAFVDGTVNEEREVNTYTRDLTKKEIYALEVHHFDALSKQKQTARDDVETAQLDEILARVATKLSKLEKLLKITRWTPEHADYLTSIFTACAIKRKQLLQSMRTYSIEHRYILSLKAKYPDGQATSTRLCRQLNRVNRRMQALLKEYNTLKDVIITPPLCPFELQWDRIVDLDDCVWHCLSSHDSANCSLLPTDKCRDLAYLIQRCREEVQLIEHERSFVWAYYEAQHGKICTAIDLGMDTSASSALFMKGVLLEYEMLEFSKIWNNLYDTPRVFNSKLTPYHMQYGTSQWITTCDHNVEYDSDCNTDSDSDIDSESDDLA